MMNKLFIPALIVAFSIAGALWMYAQQSEPKTFQPELPVMLVDVIKAKSTLVQIEVKAQGTVTPRTQTTLVSEVSGLITGVSPSFIAGGFFLKGDVLVRIDDRNYRADVKNPHSHCWKGYMKISISVFLACRRGRNR